MSLYEYLIINYKENEPIFVSEIQIKGMTYVNLRQQLKKLTDSGKIKRFDTGIYFIPKETIFRSGSQLSPYKVIEQKYLQNDNQRCGYISGIMLANQMGLTIQVPMTYEVVTNKATEDYRETKLDKTRVILRKPCVEICKLGLLLYKKSLILYLMIEQIGGASYGSRSKNFIFTRRTGETGNT